jgi:hypothetical protein
MAAEKKFYYIDGAPLLQQFRLLFDQLPNEER